MGYVKLASQKSSNKARAAELASRSVISSTSKSGNTSKDTSKAAESPAEYAIKAGIPAADLAKAGVSSEVVQQVAAAQGTTVPTSAYGTLATSKKAATTSAAATTTTANTSGWSAFDSVKTQSSTSAGSAGKEYVFQFSGPLKGSIATYVSKLVKLLGGKRAYIEEESKLVVVM